MFFFVILKSFCIFAKIITRETMRIRIAAAGLLLAIATWIPTWADTKGAATVFTKERPLVYEDAWDLWPYSYLNDRGEPEGYNVDLIELLCKEMGVPYVVRLKPTAEALSDLKAGHSDLMMGMAANFHDDYAHYGKTIIQLFTHSVVYPKNKKQEVKNVADLSNHRVMVHEGSFSHHLMEDYGWGKNAVPYDDMKEAVFVASRQENLPIVWNTLSLKWLINNLKIDNLEIAPIDIVPGEYRFMSNDHDLLERIDKAYISLQAKDKIQPLQNKWFYPEQTDTGIAAWIWYLAEGLLVLLVLCLGYFIFLHMKERKMTRLTRKENHRFSLILKTSKVKLFTYMVDTGIISVIGEDGKEARKMSGDEFYGYLPENDAEMLREIVRKVSSGELQRKRFTVHVWSTRSTGGVSDHGLNGYSFARAGAPRIERIEGSTGGKAVGHESFGEYGEKQSMTPHEGRELKEYRADVTVLRRKSDGSPMMLLGTRSDISEQRRLQMKTQDTMHRYEAIFNTPMVDMVYYDEHGLVTDINQKGCDTFSLTKEQFQARTEPVYERIGMTKEWFQTFDFFHGVLNLGNIQYELQLTPVKDNEGRRIGFYGTGLDVTPTRTAFNEQRQQVKEIEKANEKIKSYVDNINYALQAGGVRIATYSPATHLVKIFSEIDKAQYTFTQSRCIRLCDPDWAGQANRAFDSMDECIDKPQMVEIKTALQVKKGVPLFLNFHFIPSHDDNGKVVNYFGICRDVSEMRITQQQLSEEKVKMQGVEALKNSFLHNMSFEIRTPLTTVVGFSELFQMEHTSEEELVFVKEIKENSRSLLRLVNNILLLSRLDAKMIKIRTKPVDLAKTFDALCREGWNDHQEKGVSYYAENPFNQLKVEIDILNLGIVISHIVANAAQHTHQGFVRARYDYSGTALTIAVEDTGSGITEKTMEHIFERFVTDTGTGAGLGLSICKELVELMKGEINIKSRPGKGTTVWISIPCQVIEYERK